MRGRARMFARSYLFCYVVVFSLWLADRYDDVGGAKESMEKLREVVELPLLHPERFITLGIDPPKGVLLYGPRKSPLL